MTAETDKEVIYYDVPKSPPSSSSSPVVVSPQLPSGSADDDETPPSPPPGGSPKRKISTFTKVVCGSVVIAVIVLSVVLTRPGALTAFGKAPPDVSGASSGNDGDDNSTYVPTYWPTMSPIMNDDEDTNSTSTTTAATTTVHDDHTTTVAASSTTTVHDDDDDHTTTDATTTESAALGSTTTTSTEPAVETTTTTTTQELHPVCGESITAKVFKLQITPTSPNATYSFYSERDGGTTIYSSKGEGELPVDVTYEEKICIEGGRYKFSMSEGACAYGFVRGSQVFWSCVEGTSTITIE